MLLASWHLLRDSVQEFIKDNAPRLGAALAYYTALSLAPLLLLITSLAGLIFGQEAARGEIVHQLQGALGREQAETIQALLANGQHREGGIIGSIVGLVTLLIGAYGVFSSLQDALNVVWGVGDRQSSQGFWRSMLDRLRPFGMVAGMAFLLLVSLVISALLTALHGAANRWWPGAATALNIGNIAISAMLTFTMFAMIFKILPHVHLQWSDVWFGAAITTGLFAGGKYLIALYLGQAAPASTFGAAGSFVALLVWIYYSSMILLLGAEFTQVYATRHGSATQQIQIDHGPAIPSPGANQEPVAPQGFAVPG